MNFKKKTHQFVGEVLDYLYPVRLGLRRSLTEKISNLEVLLLDLLDQNIEQAKGKHEDVASNFIKNLSTLRNSLDKDILAIYYGDPAAKSKTEIIIAYPGFQAIACYRIAHFLLHQGIHLIPRIITEFAHSETGIDIHPGAKIGSSFCIDHGTGVVIGETAEIGDHVKIYQGVTLGALSVPNRENNKVKRHPTIGDHVIIYAQALILGGDTHIGQGAIVGGNVWITKSVPPYSKISFDNRGTTTILTQNEVTNL